MLGVAIRLCIGLALFYLIKPPAHLVPSPITTGRRWLAYASWLAVMSAYFPQQKTMVDYIALCVLQLTAVGAFAFAIGAIVGWWKSRSPKGAVTKSNGNQAAANGSSLRNMPNTFHVVAPISEQTISSSTRSDDWAYAQVAEEIESGNKEKATWTRAYAQTGGDDKQTKATYIKFRVERLLAERSAQQTEERRTNAEAMANAQGAQADENTRKERKANISLEGLAGDHFIAQVKSGNIEKIRKLLGEEKLYVSVCDPSTGNTPLHFAVLENNADMVRLLLQAGAPVSATNRFDRTPLDFATKFPTIRVILSEAYGNPTKSNAERTQEVTPTSHGIVFNDSNRPTGISAESIQMSRPSSFRDAGIAFGVIFLLMILYAYS